MNLTCYGNVDQKSVQYRGVRVSSGFVSVVCDSKQGIYVTGVLVTQLGIIPAWVGGMSENTWWS